MKNLKKLCSLCLVLALCLSLIPATYAATSANATIDPARTASLNLWKYDFTTANEDGILELDTYVSTGFRDDAVEEALAQYAIQGVVFSYVKVADITTYTAKEADGHEDMVLYAMSDSAKTAQLLTALGLSAADVYLSRNNTLYFISDTLVDALAARLQENSSVLKNALEAFQEDWNGTDLPETDENGHSSATDLEQGLYLLVETYVPENVSNTTAPFFLSLPMTTIDGTQWNYDVTVYPKNETDQPTLEKTLREAKEDTGKHNGAADDIGDGYAHTGTGSDSDTVEYQIVSTLPTITSNATALTTYTFLDTLSKGIAYNKGDVKLEWFRDAGCTDRITTWTEADGKFSVVYGTAENDATTMEISMTAAGLEEMNNAVTVYEKDSLFRGYSACTLRMTYACTVGSSAEVVYGDNGNPNEVLLTWKRTNTSYYDTLRDDCHFYVYALDLTKEFSDALGNFSKVQFVLHNDTDDYWVVAQLNEAEGIYYVADHVAEEAAATKFVPTKDGSIVIKGLEDDAYTITEVQTDAGYVLLKKDIRVVITSAENGQLCAICGKSGLTATATVNGDAVTMTEDNGSLSAVVPLTVVNTKGFDLPKTGERGAKMLTTGGSVLAGTGVFAILLLLISSRKKQAHQ